MAKSNSLGVATTGVQFYDGTATYTGVTGTTGQALIANTGAAPNFGTLGPSGGGTGSTTTFTEGSVIFAGASGIYSQDNANFFWDNSNDRLGLGIATPARKFDVNGTGVRFANSGNGIEFLQNSGTQWELVNLGTTTDFVFAGFTKIGIGTLTPQNLFDVNGAVAIGSYAGTATPPSNSLIISGSLGVGDTLSAVGAFYLNKTSSAQYFIDWRGTDTSSNGTCIGFNLGITLAPTAAVTDASEMEVFPVVNASSGAITNIYGLRIDNGTFSTTAATRGVGLRVDVPATGITNICAAFNGGITVGSTYMLTSPPSDGLIVSGSVGIGTTTTTYKLNVSDTILSAKSLTPSGSGTNIPNVVRTDAKFLLYDVSASNWSGMGIDASGFFWLKTGTSTTAYTVMDSGGNIGLQVSNPLNKLDVNGACAIGLYAGVNTAPSSGLIVSGNVGIGTSAISAGFNLDLVGSAIITASSENILTLTGTLVNTTNDLSGLTLVPTLQIASGSHIASAMSITPSPLAGAGTMTDCYGLLVTGGASNAVPTNGYSLFVNAPNYGTNKAAIYSKNIAVGSYTAKTPPTNGLIVSGNVGIGTSTVGTVSSNAILDVQGESTLSNIIISNFSGGAATPNAAIVVLGSRNTQASPNTLQSADNYAAVSFRGYDGTSFTGSAGKITAIATEAWTNTAHGTSLIFQNVANTTTTLLERMRIAQNGYVSIGSVANAPSILQIYQNGTETGNDAGLTVEQDGTGDAVTQFLLTGTMRYMEGIDNSVTGDPWKLAVNSSALGTNDAMIVTSVGEVTFPLTPAFFAILGSTVTDVTGNGTSFTLGTTTALTEIFDQNSDFNTNGTFTAPVTGRYRLSTGATVTGCTIATSIQIEIGTSNRTHIFIQNRAAAATDLDLFPCILADMDAADTATVLITCSGEAAATDDVFGNVTNSYTYFSGELAC